MKKIIMMVLVIIALGVSWWYLQERRVEKAPNAYKTEKVNLKLKWLHQAQFAGNYVALEKGFYKDEGLEVNIQPFSYEDGAMKPVLEGRSDFGIVGAEEVILARSQRSPVKAIAVIYKINPVAAYALKSSGIIKPQDFAGKTVGIEKGVNVEYLYRVMMRKLGVDTKNVKEISVGYDAKELLDGRVDVSTGYIINEPHLAMEAGKEVNTILMADYGVNMYADVVVTTEEMIEKRPEVVERFLRGTLNGWQYAIEHEKEAVEETMKYAKGSTVSHQSYMLGASIPLINTGNSKLGWMEESEWSQAQDILFDQKILSKKVNVKEVYTLEFLQKIYKQK